MRGILVAAMLCGLLLVGCGPKAQSAGQEKQAAPPPVTGPTPGMPTPPAGGSSKSKSQGEKPSKPGGK